MSTSPTGAGLLHVGYVGSREALGQVPGQQLARSSAHASIKINQNWRFSYIHKREVCAEGRLLYSLLCPWTFLHVIHQQSDLLKPSQRVLHSDVAVNSTVDANHTGALKHTARPRLSYFHTCLLYRVNENAMTAMPMN